MEVDWDKIDNQYKEVNFLSFNDPSITYQQQKQNFQHLLEQTNYTQQNYVSNDLYSEAGSSAIMSASQHPYTSEKILVGVSSNLYNSKPNTAQPSLSDGFKPSLNMKPVKPDGGF